MQRKRALLITAFVVTVLAILVGVFAVMHAARHRPFVNFRPIIGVLAQPYTGPYKYGDAKQLFFIPASYVKFIEMGGAQVVPVMPYSIEQDHKELFSKINGLVFPDGDFEIVNSSFADAASVLYKMAVTANNDDEFFPIWASSRGLQLLTALQNQTDLTSECSPPTEPLAINISEDAANSEMFGHLPTDVDYFLRSERTTVNFQKYCIQKQNFTNARMDDFFRILSTNLDANGVEYVSAIEAKQYPFYGVQFHPEMPNFEWVDHKRTRIPHTYGAVRVGQHLASFFVNQALQKTVFLPKHYEGIEEKKYCFTPAYQSD